MSLILDGTNGLSDVDGSAATPALRGTDANTGIFFPAADTIAFAEGGAEVMRIDSAGFVGVGTTTPTVKFEAVAGTGGLGIGLFRTGDATAANNAGGGFNATSSATAGSRLAQVWLDADGANFGGGDYFYINKIGNSGNVELIQQSNAAMTFQTNGTERMRITSGGATRIGGSFTSGASKLVVDNTNNVSGDQNTSLALGANCNNTSSYHLICATSGADKLYIYGNGNVQNVNNSYGALSDVKLKENVVDASPKLDKLNQVRIVNFNMIGAEQKQLGVIAQELEQIFPGMVEESPDRDAEGNDLGTTTKGVKYSVFVPMLIKAIQEQQALITQLQADVASLKGTTP
jgi:hypothetical protein